MEIKRTDKSEKQEKQTPLFAITRTFFEIIEESLKNGEKIEFVSFSQWQKKHNLNIKVNQKEFRPLG